MGLSRMSLGRPSLYTWLKSVVAAFMSAHVCSWAHLFLQSKMHMSGDAILFLLVIFPASSDIVIVERRVHSPQGVYMYVCMYVCIPQVTFQTVPCKIPIRLVNSRPEILHYFFFTATLPRFIMFRRLGQYIDI